MVDYQKKLDRYLEKHKSEKGLKHKKKVRELRKIINRANPQL